MDKSNMSEEFHDWLEQCPVMWSKKNGEATYTFWEEDNELDKFLNFEDDKEEKHGQE